MFGVGKEGKSQGLMPTLLRLLGPGLKATPTSKNKDTGAPLIKHNLNEDVSGYTTASW
jgi:hypothetical protein